MIARYLGLYEEGEVEHINGVWPGFLYRITASWSSNRTGYKAYTGAKNPYIYKLFT